MEYPRIIKASGKENEALYSKDKFTKDIKDANKKIRIQ